MNYPKPDIFDPVPAAAVVYLYVPEYRFEINGICDALDMASRGDLSFFDNVFGFSDGEQNEPLPSISKSFKITIQNASNEEREAKLFNAFRNKLAANFGNPADMNIYGEPDAYVNQLFQSEQVNHEVGKIRVELMRFPDSLTAEEAFKKLCLEWEEIPPPNRFPSIYRFTPRFQRYQFLQTVIDYDHIPAGIKINGFSGFNLKMPPRSTIHIEFFLSSIQRPRSVTVRY